MDHLVGKQAPDFTLEGSDRKAHRLADYAGRTVVIYFYPRDNTPGCTKEACAFADHFEEIESLDATLLGVSKDGLGSHDKFIKKFALPFTLLSDPEGTMMQAYGAFGEKKMYGKTVLGTIRSTVVIGPDGTVLKQWRPVKKAAEHPREVVEFLKAL